MFIERAIVRGLDAVVDLKRSANFQRPFQELMREGGVPVVVANHQGHADGIALAVLSDYLRRLTFEAGTDHRLRGLAVPIAASMDSGHQSSELKWIFDVIKGAVYSKGVVPIPVTRKKDETQYGMNRQKMAHEGMAFVAKLKEGYGIGTLPEASVQGGRHPVGSDIEQIYGMQEVLDSGLIDIYQLTKRITNKQGRWPFFIPVALHGSYRFMNSPEGGRPKPTLSGLAAIISGVVGLPVFIKIETTPLAPITDEDMAKNLGSDWVQDYVGSNRFIMTRIAEILPSKARGRYAFAA